jgi:hypothetical protein
MQVMLLINKITSLTKNLWIYQNEIINDDPDKIEMHQDIFLL